MSTGLRSVVGEGGDGDPREEKAQYWRREVAGWKHSGRSQADFCRCHGLSRHQFTYWKRRFADEGEKSLALVEVPQALVANTSEMKYAAGPALVIETGRYRVELAPDFCARSLSAVLDELERRR